MVSFKPEDGFWSLRCIAAVTLAGGRIYHRMLPAHKGQHAIRWFIHDSWAMFAKGTEMDIPHSWINSTLAGDDIALHIEHSDSISNQIAAIISRAPASVPSRRTLVIQRKGNAGPTFLDILSPLVKLLHYLLLLPHGTLGWSPNRRTSDGMKFSQARWYRTRFFMNAEQLSGFSRLTGEWLVDAWSAIEQSRLTYIRLNQHSDPDEAEYIGTGDEEPIDDVRLPSTCVHSQAYAAHFAGLFPDILKGGCGIIKGSKGDTY
ncbi:hypothetical protein B0H17DRAFT_1128444 [Mycena rosella]|uniref:Uncharacterized protein n=1 Tax=Mycena rosella TaxID=1033263 RepID=A0AAD7DYE8_MYCRO|nr:hypothetical protein B0H17DRAFT_1128444 [Mycena rosella]